MINGLISATKVLRPGGKIVIVSFHSIEDKIIKYLFSNYSKNKSKSSRYLPEESTTLLTLFEEYKIKSLPQRKKKLIRIVDLDQPN